MINQVAVAHPTRVVVYVDGSLEAKYPGRNWREVARGYCGRNRVLAGVKRFATGLRLGVELVRGAWRDRYDEAFLITADAPGLWGAAERVANGVEFGGRKTVTILRAGRGPGVAGARIARRRLSGRLRVLDLRAEVAS